MSNEIGLREARNQLGEIANRANLAGEITYLMRNGKRIAAIVPIHRVSQESTMSQKTMTAQELAYAVSLTMGDHADDFDIPAMVEEIRSTYGSAHIDDIPASEYTAILERHDTTQRATTGTYTLTVVRGEQPGGNGEELGSPQSPITYSDLPDEVTDWLTSQSFDVEDPDVWVLVTPADEDPRVVNVIASRDITVQPNTED